MRPYLICLFIFLSATASSQYKIKIDISSLPAYHQKGSAIYIAGSFNAWNPTDENYRLEYDDGRYEIKLKLPQGAYEFKLTRGSWEKVETNSVGKGIANRELVVTGDLEITLSIEGWQDHFPAAPKTSTASHNVNVLDTAFYIPQLNRTRRVWVYLPASYEEGRRRFPVLYMHDGQNVFDDATSFSGEWGVDEFMDTTNLANSIVVAVDHGGQFRLNEYSPYDMDNYGKGYGDQYADFIVKTLKPYIDKKFRTMRGRSHTFLAGSSMGGLITMYSILKYPSVFGGAAIFSPAFWVAPKIFDKIRERGRKIKANIFFYAGKKESESMVQDMMKAMELLGGRLRTEMKGVIRDEGMHNEATWRQEFPGGYRWLINGF